MTEAALLNGKNNLATTSESVKQGKTMVNTQKGQTTRKEVFFKFLRGKISPDPELEVQSDIVLNKFS